MGEFTSENLQREADRLLAAAGDAGLADRAAIENHQIFDVFVTRRAPDNGFIVGGVVYDPRPTAPYKLPTGKPKAWCVRCLRPKTPGRGMYCRECYQRNAKDKRAREIFIDNGTALYWLQLWDRVTLYSAEHNDDVSWDCAVPDFSRELIEMISLMEETLDTPIFAWHLLGWL